MKKITPFLWFDGKAEEAMNFYTSIFKNSKALNVSSHSVTFELDGQEFIGLNGGPQFPFTEAVSFFIRCETQEEVDDFWEKLSEGGKKSLCGWLKDKFGVSWQVVPIVLFELLNDPDPNKSENVMNALLTMQKLDIEALKRAHQG